MRRALQLAIRGRGLVSPNPMVGAVLVRKGTIVGEGWHRRWGGPHAEVDALSSVSRSDARGSTLYVTLEPCAHSGKTPPCTDAILEAKVGRVVSAMLDPNPHVTGGGGRVLARGGVGFETGLGEVQSRRLNAGFIHWADTGRPLVTLKIASSLDGGIATRSGDSKWITGEKARREAHRLRAEHDAIVVGAGTVLADDPELTVRHVRGRNPVRIVLDPGLSTSPQARWMASDGTRRIIVAGKGLSESKLEAFRSLGAEVWTLPMERTGGLRLDAVLKKAGAVGLLSLLIEGGGRLAGAFLAAGLVDRVRIFTAPVLLGGDALGWTQGLFVNQVAGAPRLKNVRVRRFGDDWQIEGEVAG